MSGFNFIKRTEVRSFQPSLRSNGLSGNTGRRLSTLKFLSQAEGTGAR